MNKQTRKHRPLPSFEELHEDESCGTLNEALIDETLKRFAVKYDIAEDQTDTFSPAHRRYNVELLLDGEKILGTTYQCNPQFHDIEGSHVWEAVANDAIAYTESEDLAQFLEDNYYLDNAKSVRKGTSAYESCKIAHETLTKLGIDPELVKQFFGLLDDNDYPSEVDTTEEHI